MKASLIKFYNDNEEMEFWPIYVLLQKIPKYFQNNISHLVFFQFFCSRYGGQYSDLDTVSLLRTSHLENVVSVSGDFISNANMILAPRHPLVLALMRAADKRFTGRGWNSLGWRIISCITFSLFTLSGPVLLTDTLASLCSIKTRTREIIFVEFIHKWRKQLI